MASSTCLADKDASQLDQGDVSCFICMSILIEPVTMPCQHTMCMVSDFFFEF